MGFGRKPDNMAQETARLKILFLRELDLVTKDRIRIVFKHALPIVIGMISANLVTLVDTAMVGVLGKTALAAIGLGGFTFGIIIALIMSMGVGVQAMTSRRFGEEQTGHEAQPLNTGLLIAVAFGVPVTILAYPFVPSILSLFSENPEVIQKSTVYLRIVLFSTLACGVNTCFRGFWNGIGKAKYYMWTLLLMHTWNIKLNYILIFGKYGFPALGVTGAAIASLTSYYIAFFSYFILALRHGRHLGFLSLRPTMATARTLFNIIFPASIRNVLNSLGNFLLFAIISIEGTSAQAAATVLLRLNGIGLLPAMGMGMTGSILAGHALGRKDPEDATRWGWDVAKINLVMLILLGLPLILFPEPILRIFLHDAATIEMARLPLRIMGALAGIGSGGILFIQMLVGVGDSKRTMFVNIALFWFFLLPAAWLAGPYFGGGLLAIWIVYGSYAVLMALSFAGMWHGGRWKAIEI